MKRETTTMFIIQSTPFEDDGPIIWSPWREKLLNMCRSHISKMIPSEAIIPPLLSTGDNHEYRRHNRNILFKEIILSS